MDSLCLRVWERCYGIGKRGEQHASVEALEGRRAGRAGLRPPGRFRELDRKRGFSSTQISFKMVRSATALAASCLPNAGADVTDQSSGPVETLTVAVHGLPANTDFDFFVIQVPNGPFGLSWYQGDIETGSDGSGHGVFVGRFSVETFIVAPGVARLPSSQQTSVPGRELEPRNEACPHVPPRVVVQRSGRCSLGWLPRRHYTVQWRSQRRCTGVEYTPVHKRRGPFRLVVP